MPLLFHGRLAEDPPARVPDSDKRVVARLGRLQGCRASGQTPPSAHRQNCCG